MKKYKLSDLLAIPLKNGVSKPSRIRGEGYKMVNMGELFANSFIDDIEMERVPMTPREIDNYLLEFEDLLFARQSLTVEGAGKCSIFVGKNRQTTYEGHLMRLRLNRNLATPRYIFYYFNSLVGKNQIKTIVTSTAAAGIRGSDLINIELTIPKLETQTKIASILSSLDEKIELNRQTNKTLEEIAQTLFKEMCLPKSDELPDGWRIGMLGEIMESKGGTTPSTSNEEYWNGEYNWVTPKDLSNLHMPVLLSTNRLITEKGLKQISSGLLPVGTLLMSSRAPIGYFAISQIPVAINQGFIAMNGTSVSNLFLLYWLKHNIETVKNMANGSTFLEISKSVFRNIEIVIPSNNSLKQFEWLIEPIFQKIINNEQQTQTLISIRDSLLPKLMKGEIEV